MTLEDAVAAAKAFQQLDDFSTPYSADGDVEAWRLQAIAGVAAAVLVVDFAWAQERNLIAWSRDILLAAARMPSHEHPIADRHTRFPFDPRVSAGRGLGVLVAHGEADAEVREQVLRLVAHPQLQVVEAVFLGLYDAWLVDETLCWNALSLGLSLCLPPRKLGARHDDAAETKRVEDLLHRYVNNLKKNSLPPFPRILITTDIIFLWDSVQRPLCALPFHILLGNVVTKEKLLRLTDDLITWTITENTPAADDPHSYRTHAPYEWNHFFLDWVARLSYSLSIEETRQHVLTPIRNSWSSAPRLTGDLLWGYIQNHLGYMTPPTQEAQEAWRESCHWVLDDPKLATAARRDFLSRDAYDALSLIVFARYGTACLKSEWPHALLFTDVIDKWVSVIGFHPDAYSSLITMLNSVGWNLVPEPALTWLHQCVNNSTDSSKFWKKHSNGERTAEILQRMWNDMERGIRENIITLQRYATLIDTLVAAGIPLAGLLQRKLDR